MNSCEELVDACKELDKELQLVSKRYYEEYAEKQKLSEQICVIQNPLVQLAIKQVEISNLLENRIGELESEIKYIERKTGAYV